MSILDTAIALACKVHAGQVDKSGAPYILHPLRLMLSFQHENERIVSVLHDVVEDGNVTLDDLRQLGLSEMVIEAINCLSKSPGESYEHFISRLSVNKLARKVKIADIKDNLDVTRLHSLNDLDLARVKKYNTALRYLLGDSNL
jgi:(p)ppGpp synthase/HD superfamily hydrolase